METKRKLALFQAMGYKVNEIEVGRYDDTLLTVGNEEYRVLTDDEADEVWEEALDNYLEECVYPDLPENMVRYFDNEAWKRDARFDGRGHALSYYDGEELEETVNYRGDEDTFYIYRVN